MMRCGQTYKWLILLTVHGFWISSQASRPHCSMTPRLSCRMVPSCLPIRAIFGLSLLLFPGMVSSTSRAPLLFIQYRVEGWTGAFCLLFRELERLYEKKGNLAASIQIQKQTPAAVPLHTVVEHRVVDEVGRLWLNFSSCCYVAWSIDLYSWMRQWQQLLRNLLI